MQTPIVGTNVRRVRKTMRVKYARPVRDSVRQLVIIPPLQREQQRIVSCHWQSFPPPDAARETLDQWNNRVLELQHKHLKEWNFALHLEICDHAQEQVLALDRARMGAWRLPSALCPLTDQIQRLAATSASTCKVFERALQLNSLVFNTLEYRENCTDANSSAQDALTSRTGVCQDFAHLFIALCRASGIAARYVSGYGVAAGRMHAWAEVWDNLRWCAFDPTRGTLASVHAVAVAHGRDYRDVVPHSGTFRAALNNARLQTLCTLQVLADDQENESTLPSEQLQ